MEVRWAGERGMGERDEGWRRDGRRNGLSIENYERKIDGRKRGFGISNNNTGANSAPAKIILKIY